MPGSLSVANTAVSSANIAVVETVEFGRSAVYSRYNSGLKTPAWGATAFTVKSSLETCSLDLYSNEGGIYKQIGWCDL
jgi:hypothetical protein